MADDFEIRGVHYIGGGRAIRQRSCKYEQRTILVHTLDDPTRSMMAGFELPTKQPAIVAHLEYHLTVITTIHYPTDTATLAVEENLRRV